VLLVGTVMPNGELNPLVPSLAHFWFSVDELLGGETSTGSSQS
jgi:hypothetical protein